MPQDTALHKAANGGDVAECQDIVAGMKLQPDFDINAAGAAERTPVQRACGAGQLPVAQYLVTEGADVNKQDKAKRTCIHWAAVGGHLECIEWLLADQGVDVNAQSSSGMTALHVAAETGRSLFVARLLFHGADPSLLDSDGKSPVNLAAEKGHKAIGNWFKLHQKNGTVTEEDLQNTEKVESGTCSIM
jgi:ankyrin repeat protein